MTQRFETKGEYELAIIEVLGYDKMPSTYQGLMTSLTTKALDVVLSMLEDASGSISTIVDVDGEDAAKLQAIEEAARVSHGKLADTILAIIDSGDFKENDSLETDDVPFS